VKPGSQPDVIQKAAHALIRLTRDPELRAQAGKIATQRAAGSEQETTDSSRSMNPPRMQPT